MDEPFLALHRAILAVDIESFADRRRTNPDQVLARGGLYRCTETAFARSGIAWEACYREDRGDGALILHYAGLSFPPGDHEYGRS